VLSHSRVTGHLRCKKKPATVTTKVLVCRTLGTSSEKEKESVVPLVSELSLLS